MIVRTLLEHQNRLLAQAASSQNQRQQSKREGEGAVERHGTRVGRERGIQLSPPVELLAPQEGLDGGERRGPQRGQPDGGNRPSAADLMEDRQGQRITQAVNVVGGVV